MTLAATYDPVLSRIRLAGTFLSPAVYVVFDRTVDGVSYTTVRGGSGVTVVSQNANADDYEFPPGVPITYRLRGYSALDVLLFTDTAAITQDVAAPWIKVPAAPYLNTEVAVLDRSEVTRRSRAGVFDIVGRTNPLMVGDVASSRAYTLQVLTESAADESNLDYLFASGEVVFVQAPLAATWLPTGYWAVGDANRIPVSKVSEHRIWSIPLTEVAAPGPEVVGSAYTWASAVAEYATWADLIAGNATWADLLQRTGSPSDVIVP